MEPSRKSGVDAGGAASAALVAAASAALSTDGGGFGALERSDFAICVVDALSPGQPILFANAAFIEISGYPADETVGRSCQTLLGGDARALKRFRESVQAGRPFHVALVNRSRDGEPLHNEIFLSPVRDAAGAVARYAGILIPVSPQDADAADAEIAALRHQFRNQIQTLQSLVGLFGQRLPAGEGRDAFQDLRARIEAVTITQTEEFAAGGPVALDGALGRLADRLVQIYDPLRDRGVVVTTSPGQASARRAATLAQILAELVVDLFRSGLAEEAGGSPSIAIEGLGDGGVRLAASRSGGRPPPPDPCGALGLAIVESLARGLEGDYVRRSEDGFFAEAVIPKEPRRR